MSMKSVDIKQVYRNAIDFLGQSMKHAGFRSAVIALSGGVDSSVSVVLSVRAIGKNNVYPLLLPYGNLNFQGVSDAQLVIKTLGIPPAHVRDINIQPLVDPITALDPDLPAGRQVDRLRRGNTMARVRMILLYDLAKKNNALVVGTENKMEHLLGYYTRFGDEASDIEPLRNLYKTDVRRLAQALGLPQTIITKAPTAGLWDGQPDEGEFGFTYEEADRVLALIVDEKKSIDEVIAKGYDRSTVEKVVKRMNDNDFKHRLPFVPS